MTQELYCMKRMVAGGAAFALAGVGMVALGGAAGAQEDDLSWLNVIEQSATVAPVTAEAGQEITVTPDAPCVQVVAEEEWQEFFPPDISDLSTYILGWDLYVGGTFPGWDAIFEGGEDDLVADTGEVGVDADGNWTVTFTAPSAGTYEFVALCLPGSLVEEDGDAEADLGDDFDLEELEDVDAETLTIPEGEPTYQVAVYGPEDLTVEAGEAPPAPAIPDVPTVTG